MANLCDARRVTGLVTSDEFDRFPHVLSLRMRAYVQ
jgi:hypothetical protein